MKKAMKAWLVLLLTVAAQLSATAQVSTPNYDDPSQWYITQRQGTVDLFYIISTETGDYSLASGEVCHYADTHNELLRAPMRSEMLGVDSLLSGQMNFFSPFYRQCSLQSFVSEDLTAQRIKLPTDDVRRAFSYYLKHHNNGRPFILAGFSQGALIALQLLREMDDDTYRRMVAAYIIGVPITQQMLDECPRICPAQREDDTGVTICYNSVRNDSCSLWGTGVVAINPVNWHTDDVSATLITEPSPLIPIDQQQKDTLSVRLSTKSHQLIVSGYTADDYVLPLIGREGNYHSREIWLYRDALRQNMQRRAEAFQFVHITDVVPDAILEIRYFGTYNFVGQRIDGYEQPTAMLSRQAADSLRSVSDDVMKLGYRLKIYDAYRPQMAVDHFVRWASNLSDTKMKPYFYPDLDKSVLFQQDYIAEKSGHTRGSTVDLTLFDMSTGKELDMGGTFDWFGPESHPDFCGNPATSKFNGNNSKSPKNRKITPEQFRHRMILRQAMMRHGFRPLSSEWWHFTLNNEPFPDTYFTFPVK